MCLAKGQRAASDRRAPCSLPDSGSVPEMCQTAGCPALSGYLNAGKFPLVPVLQNTAPDGLGMTDGVMFGQGLQMARFAVSSN